MGLNLTLCFFKRQANKVAHSIASAFYSNASTFYWHVAPFFLVKAVGFLFKVS